MESRRLDRIRIKQIINIIDLFTKRKKWKINQNWMFFFIFVHLDVSPFAYSAMTIFLQNPDASKTKSSKSQPLPACNGFPSGLSFLLGSNVFALPLLPFLISSHTCLEMKMIRSKKISSLFSFYYVAEYANVILRFISCTSQHAFFSKTLIECNYLQNEGEGRGGENI